MKKSQKRTMENQKIEKVTINRRKRQKKILKILKKVSKRIKSCGCKWQHKVKWRSNSKKI